MTSSVSALRFVLSRAVRLRARAHRCTLRLFDRSLRLLGSNLLVVEIRRETRILDGAFVFALFPENPRGAAIPPRRFGTLASLKMLRCVFERIPRRLAVASGTHRAQA